LKNGNLSSIDTKTFLSNSENCISSRLRDNWFLKTIARRIYWMKALWDHPNWWISVYLRNKMQLESDFSTKGYHSARSDNRSSIHEFKQNQWIYYLERKISKSSKFKYVPKMIIIHRQSNIIEIRKWMSNKYWII
jgi:hypothetical protein